MKTILVVDDDKTVRAAVKRALGLHCDEFLVLEASHGEEAVQLVEERPVELVITDLWMPVMDGFQFLVHLMNHHPTLPVMVLSSHEPWDGLRGLGMKPQVPCVSKPVNAQALLLEIYELLQERERGRRAGVTLFGFLQLLARERRTCMLEVGTNGHAGTIHVLAGELVHAKTAGHEGEEALFEILGWREQRLHMVPALPELKLTIATRMDWLLAKALATRRSREGVTHGVYPSEPGSGRASTKAPWAAPRWAIP